MIRNLRAFFLGRLLREKLLLLAFIVLGVLWWLSAFSQRTGVFWRQQASTSRTLKEQKLYIDNSRAVEELAVKAAKSLEPALTLDGTRLVGTVNQAAGEAGLKNQAVNLVGRETSGQFTVHSVRFTVNGASGEAVQKFINLLQKRAPYLSLEQFTLTSNPRTPAQLNLSLNISSVEVGR